MSLSRLLPSLLLLLLPSCPAFPKATIVSPRQASPVETLAAHEVRRYFYLRTGELAEIVVADQPPAGDAIVVARKDRPLASSAAVSLAAQQYALKTIGATRYLVGGDDIGHDNVSLARTRHGSSQVSAELKRA